MDKIKLMIALKELAKGFQPGLLRKLRKGIYRRELNLLDYVFERHYREDVVSGRWYDPCRIIFSASFALELVKTNRCVSPLIVPAIILHDIGYYAIPDRDSNWNASQNRIIHMQEGAALSSEILVRVGGYDARQIGIIVGMVASHDNLILDIPVKDPVRLALIDADRAWAMHFISFWKDFASEAGQAKDLSPLELLDIRQKQFYENIIPNTSLAKQWRDKQFKKRLKEIQDNIIKDKNIFWKRTEKAINSKTG